MIHGDDTSVKLRLEGADRAHKAHLWACLGDADYPYAVFDFTKGYSADGPEAFPHQRTVLVSGRRLTWYGPSLATARQDLLQQIRGLDATSERRWGT